MGVSPAANIYGVRVLNSQGSGDDESILLGLLYIYLWYFENNSPPTVINMSLGGTCASYEDCAVDTLVNAVEVLSKAGIVVVVAAGNSACDACLETPAFAASAITVGASTIDDKAAFFSDYGKCVDLYAPGFNITSACASIMCNGKHTEYTTMSGTSMASPHTAGVVAQALELEILLAEAIAEAEHEDTGKTQDVRSLILTDEEVQDEKKVSDGKTKDNSEDLTIAYLTAHSLSCLGSKMRLTIDRGEGNSAEKTTRNIIAQVPYGKPTYAAARSLCDLSASCRAEGLYHQSTISKAMVVAVMVALTVRGRWRRSITSGSNYNACSGHGYCQQSQCLCDTGYWGTNCSSKETGFSCSEGMQYIPFSLYDLSATGAGWAGAEYRLLGPHLSSSLSSASSSYTGSVPVAASSMCGGIVTSAGVCLSLLDDPKALAEAHEAMITSNSTSSSSSSSSSSNSAEQLSYALDVVPGAVGQGSMAAWSMCGRMGSAPARWEVVVWPDNSSNVLMEVPGDGGAAIFTNINAVFGQESRDDVDDDDDDDDDGGNGGTPPTRQPSRVARAKITLTRTSPILKPLQPLVFATTILIVNYDVHDKSAIGEVYFRLENLFDETFDAGAENRIGQPKKYFLGQRRRIYCWVHHARLVFRFRAKCRYVYFGHSFPRAFFFVEASLMGEDANEIAKRSFPWVQTHSFASRRPCLQPEQALSVRTSVLVVVTITCQSTWHCWFHPMVPKPFIRFCHCPSVMRILPL